MKLENIHDHTPVARTGQVAEVPQKPHNGFATVFDTGIFGTYRKPHACLLRDNLEFFKQANKIGIIFAIEDYEAGVNQKDTGPSLRMDGVDMTAWTRIRLK